MRVDLPPPETPVMQVKRPERNLAGDVLQIVAAWRRPLSSLRLGVGSRRRAGPAISRAPVRYWPVRTVGLAMISAGVPCGDDLAAVDAGAGAHVDRR